MQEIQRSQFLARKLHADLEHDARKVQEAKLGAMEATGDVSDSIRSLVHAFIHSFLPSFLPSFLHYTSMDGDSSCGMLV